MLIAIAVLLVGAALFPTIKVVERLNSGSALASDRQGLLSVWLMIGLIGLLMSGLVISQRVRVDAQTLTYLQPFSRREVRLADIQNVSVYLLSAGEHSGLVLSGRGTLVKSLNINLSPIATLSVVTLLQILAQHAPDAQFNDLAAEIRDGKVPRC